MKVFALALLTFLNLRLFADTQPIPYTMEDRDRLLRVEESIKLLNSKMDEKFNAMYEKFNAIDSKFDSQNDRFDAIQKQIDFTNNLILTLIAGMLGSLIYMWWDRRSANAPLKDDIEMLQKKEKNLLKALKEYADSHPELKTIFDRAAIL
ncbi:MAG: hypothetical protein EAZ53_02595 [Bacteroidetes bacterium]|nr:MAG: hypothetical protein EAZ53_02595 [Bacteroidota bacterium]